MIYFCSSVCFSFFLLFSSFSIIFLILLFVGSYSFFYLDNRCFLSTVHVFGLFDLIFFLFGHSTGIPVFMFSSTYWSVVFRFKMAAHGDLYIVRQNDPRETEKIICKAVQLGYETIAVGSTCELTTARSKKEKQKSICQPPFEWKELPGIKTSMASNRRLKIFSRLTVILEDQSQLHQLASSSFTAYDILAVRPTTEKLFQQCCGSLEADIISLDLTSKLPFYLKLPQVNQAIERGVHFEIVYSPAIRNTTQRKYLISNALEITRATKGRNVFFSSEAEKAVDLRGPYDVSNLGLLFGLKEEQCKAAISKNIRAILYHAESRKTAAKSTITGCHLKPVSKAEIWKIGKRTGQNNHDDSDGIPKKKKNKLS